MKRDACEFGLKIMKDQKGFLFFLAKRFRNALRVCLRVFTFQIYFTCAQQLGNFRLSDDDCPS